jgi:hypothetical protein
VNQLSTATSDWLAVASLLSDASFELDLDFHFTGFGAASVFGHATAALIGKPAMALLAGAGGEFNEILAKVLHDELVWQGHVTVMAADGTPHTCRLAVAPKLNAYGKRLGLYGLLTDMAAPELAVAPPPLDGIPVDRALDLETGIWSAASFVEQASRRFDRLDVESQPGTLLFLGFGRATPMLQAPTAMRLADELREIVRPTDLLGRINRTTIALWCDGMDHLTGAERAARFCKHMPASLPDQTLVCVGLVTRWPGSTDDPATLLDRAALALKDAYAATARDANGSWRVWQPVPPI